jgi:cupin fold WbuC family metalloprotein
MLTRSDGPDATIVGAEDLTEVAEGIFYSRRLFPVVNEGMIAFLKGLARTVPRRRARFCAHLSPDADQHDMLIVSHRDTYVSPHRHLGKAETFCILEGIAEIILFHENGEVQKTLKMGPASSGLPFFYRMPPGQFHSLFIESELLVFLESTKGPFTLADREHATWAPDPDDAENGKAYIASIVGQRTRSTTAMGR